MAYNVAATVASIPTGRFGDRRGAVLVLVLGVALFGLAYAGFAAGPTSVLALAPWFVAAGVAIGCVETAEHAAVAALAPVELRGSAFGCWRRCRASGIWPPAPSPVCSGRPCRLGSPSPTSWPGWLSRWLGCCWLNVVGRGNR